MLTFLETPNFSSAHLESSFDNPAENFLLNVRDFFAQSQKINAFQHFSKKKLYPNVSENM